MNHQYFFKDVKLTDGGKDLIKSTYAMENRIVSLYGKIEFMGIRYGNIEEDNFIADFTTQHFNKKYLKGPTDIRSKLLKLFVYDEDELNVENKKKKKLNKFYRRSYEGFNGYTHKTENLNKSTGSFKSKSPFFEFKKNAKLINSIKNSPVKNIKQINLTVSKDMNLSKRIITGKISNTGKKNVANKININKFSLPKINNYQRKNISMVY